MISKSYMIDKKKITEALLIYLESNGFSPDFEIPKYLIKMGADINGKNKQGHEPLYYLCDHYNVYCFHKEKKILSDNGLKKMDNLLKFTGLMLEMGAKPSPITQGIIANNKDLKRIWFET